MSDEIHAFANEGEAKKKQVDFKRRSAENWTEKVVFILSFRRRYSLFILFGAEFMRSPFSLSAHRYVNRLNFCSPHFDLIFNRLFTFRSQKPLLLGLCDRIRKFQ